MRKIWRKTWVFLKVQQNEVLYDYSLKMSDFMPVFKCLLVYNTYLGQHAVYIEV